MSPGERFLNQLYQLMPIRFAFEPGTLKGLNSLYRRLFHSIKAVSNNCVADSLYAVNITFRIGVFSTVKYNL